MRALAKLGFDPRAVVAAAIRRGLATMGSEETPAARTRRRDRSRMRKLYVERLAAGLTTAGNVRQRVMRPELDGLIGREYHTAYMRLVRAKGKT